MKTLKTLLCRIFFLVPIFCLSISDLSANPIDDAKKLIKEGHEKALEILLPLGEQNNDGAIQNKIGEIYHFGRGVIDYDKAREWYLKAVQNGNGQAANHLGRLYLNGEGVPRNKETAKNWYRKSMKLGWPDGKKNYLGMNAK